MIPSHRGGLGDTGASGTIMTPTARGRDQRWTGGWLTDRWPASRVLKITICGSRSFRFVGLAQTINLILRTIQGFASAEWPSARAAR
jgi:hypothetical protein